MLSRTLGEQCTLAGYALKMLGFAQVLGSLASLPGLNPFDPQT